MKKTLVHYILDLNKKCGTKRETILSFFVQSFFFFFGNANGYPSGQWLTIHLKKVFMGKEKKN